MCLLSCLTKKETYQTTWKFAAVPQSFYVVSSTAMTEALKSIKFSARVSLTGVQKC